MIQPSYSALTCAKMLNLSSKLRIEGVFKDLEEVKKPISLSANAFILSKDVKNDCTHVKSRVIFTLVYLSEDGYKKAIAEADGVLEVDSASANVSVFTTDVKLVNSNGFIGACTLNCTANTKAQTQKDVLTGGEGICIKTKEISVDLYNNERQGQRVISDEFSLDFTVGEVLSYGAVAYVNSTSCEMGRIILEGEAVLTVKVLPFSENNDIVKERRVIPFRYELEDSEALKGDKAYGFVCVDGTNVKIFADEGRERSNVTADITLSFFGGSVSVGHMSVVEDAYLKLSDCELKKEEINLLSYGAQRCVSEKVVCLGGANADGGRIITTLGESFSLIAVSQSDNGVTIDGAVRVDVVLKNADNGIATIPCECPVTVDFTSNGKIDTVRVIMTDVNARVRNGEVELECHFKIYYSEFFEQMLSCVTDITELGARRDLEGAICVCIAKAGEELWDVAKKLGSDEQEILQFNSDTVFPLASDERIIIYRQKL
ncbi:MAG: DUF3794 domain-containing protein [Clostridia bacterium]|nr:DUF3794 domain-containing protein [Clostridia bacterium]